MHNIQVLLIVGAIGLVVSTTASSQQAWSIVENKSPTNDSEQLGAAMVVGDAALILRCREQTTEVAFSTKNTYLGDQSVTVRYRINSENDQGGVAFFNGRSRRICAKSLGFHSFSSRERPRLHQSDRR
jgi:hypothetical protein